MKLSKNRLKEILKEEISLYINSVKTEKLMTKINESKEPNYSPKLATTPAENVIVQSLDAKALDNGKGETLLYFEKEEGVDTSDVK